MLEGSFPYDFDDFAEATIHLSTTVLGQDEPLLLIEVVDIFYDASTSGFVSTPTRWEVYLGLSFVAECASQKAASARLQEEKQMLTLEYTQYMESH